MIQIGDVIRDDDPRMKGRELRVIAIGDTHAICENALAPGLRTRIALDRIHEDDHARKRDFSKVVKRTR